MEEKWKKIAIHDEDNIKGFFGEYRFLSNYHKCKISFRGMEFGSTEAAYQAAKCVKLEDVQKFLDIEPNASKKLGRLIQVRPDWNEVKYEVMSMILFEKFGRHRELRKLLLETENKFIEETNYWGDVYWGVCDGIGENNLGKILMRIREFWK